MLTRNFDNFLAQFITDATNIKSSDRTDANFTNGNLPLIKNYNGKIGSLPPSPNTLNFANILSTRDLYTSPNSVGQYGGIVLGSNDAEESYDDYTVTSISSLTKSSFSNSVSVSDGNLYYKKTLIVLNNTTSDITVNELGVFLGYLLAYFGTSSSTSVGKVLMYRKKFDTPIIVPANGGAGNIEFTFTLPLFVNKPIS